jgi:hypothetical protein
LKRQSASYLSRFLAQDRSVGPEPSFSLEFEGFFVERSGKHHPFVQFAHAVIGQWRAEFLIAVALFIEDLEPFDLKVFDGLFRHETA